MSILRKAIDENNPQLIADHVGHSIQEIIDDKHIGFIGERSCCLESFQILRYKLDCTGIQCSECPFYQSIENTIDWLKSSKSKPEFEVGKWYKNIGSNKKYIVKLNDVVNNNEFPCIEYINDKIYDTTLTGAYFNNYEHAVLADYKDYAKYLPKGHRDLKEESDDDKWRKDIKKGDYVVVTKAVSGKNGNLDHIYKADEDGLRDGTISIGPYDTIGPVVKVRKATQKEILLYEHAGKPVDVTKPKNKRWCVRITENNKKIVAKFYADNVWIGYDSIIPEKVGKYITSHNIINGESVFDDPKSNFIYERPTNTFPEITTQEFYDIIKYKQSTLIEPELKLKSGAYIMYLGTKEGKTLRGWKKYFEEYGIKKGDVGVIVNIYNQKDIFIKDNKRGSYTGGRLFLTDIKLITKSEYDRILSKGIGIQLERIQPSKKSNRIKLYIKPVKPRKRKIKEYTTLNIRNKKTKLTLKLKK